MKEWYFALWGNNITDKRMAAVARELNWGERYEKPPMTPECYTGSGALTLVLVVE